MAITSVDLNPNFFQIISIETIPITVEWIDLVGNNAVSIPSAIMIDQANNMVVPNGFQNNFGANGTQAQYIIQGSVLQPGHRYTALLSVNIGSQIFKARMYIEVLR